ncbi:formate/nitrite transporter family protein [Streptococcus ovuberis]|uniref:Formate-nitrite transporter n=1 Tax=Streptococcus ovuberis TaxID=1936207 RepID=A0A7X6S1P1_9STRE|nr:formate/nitrite transporter family protein [Streptococcus ovuberis]NKZ21017.1 formate-nitrite transporter [Streptococcus ovuberis]
MPVPTPSSHSHSATNSELIGSLAKSIEKKDALSRHSFLKYAVRAMLATLFLALGTGIAFYIAGYANDIIPHSGKFFYAFMFSWSLVMIVYMNAELGTSNMMYMTSAVYNGKLRFLTAGKILATCIFFNLVGALLFSYLLSLTTAYSHLPADHYLFEAVATKLAKTPLTQFVEGIFANIVVNTSLFVTLRMKDDAGKVFAMIFIIFIFAFLGFEHVIANFVSFPLAFFANGGPVEGMTLWNVLSNFFFSGLGNYVGGGLIIGLLYSWLNKKSDVYVD